MALDYDLTTEVGLETFRVLCEVLRDIVISLFVDGSNRLAGSIIISSYMLREVGLRFPLPRDLCYLLNGLKMTLECFRSNVFRLLLGVALVNQRLNIFLGDQKVFANYIFGVNHGEP